MMKSVAIGSPPESCTPIAGFALSPGVSLGKFELERQLASGGMGWIYAARDKLTGAEVALKVLIPAPLADPERLGRFKRESLICQQLNHPNIIRTFDIGEDAGCYFISMELLEGCDLRALLDEEPRPELARIHALSMQVLAGLEFPHEREIVHRDLKPQNVFVTRTGSVKLLDFGVAHALTVSVLTTPGAMLGTPGYISPEQAQGKTGIDGRADVYSWGVVLYEMLTGRLPFRGDSPIGIAAAHAYEPPPPIHQVRRDTPAQLAAVVMRCLHKDPAARYAGAAELREALTEAMREAGVPVAAVAAAIANARTPTSAPLKPVAGDASSTRLLSEVSMTQQDRASLVGKRAVRIALLGWALVGTIGLGTWAATRPPAIEDACDDAFDRIARDDRLGARTAFAALGASRDEQACRLQSEAGVLLAQGQLGAARERVARALSIEPGLIYARVLEGDLATIDQQPVRAEQSYRAAVSGRLGSPAQRALALARLARLALERGEIAAAQRYLQQTSPAGGRLPDVRQLWAQLDLERADAEASGAQHPSALELEPSAASASPRLANAWGRDALSADAERLRRVDELIGELAKRYRAEKGRSPAVTRSGSPDGAERLRTFWILPLDGAGASEARNGFAEALALALERELDRPPTKVVDRALLDRLLSELNLGASPLVQPETSLELGRLMSARYMVRSQLTRLDDSLVLNVRVTEVETSDLVLSDSFAVPPAAKPHDIAAAVIASFDRRLGTVRDPVAASG